MCEQLSVVSRPALRGIWGAFLVLAFATAGIPLGAEKIFNIGPLAFTNSMLFGLIIAALLISIFTLAAKRSATHPRSKLAFYVESLVEIILGLMTESLGSREKALKHFPLLFGLFIFILSCNLSGLLPGVGTLTINHGGEAVPLLRGFTIDLNSTLAMAVLALGTVQVYAIKELGFLGHLLHYFHNDPFKPLNIFTGINEIFGDFMRLVTLTLRLFGVMYGGEALIYAISVLAGNFSSLATLPLVFLEIFFSLVQAYLFMMLTATYLSMATTPIEDHGPDGAYTVSV